MTDTDTDTDTFNSKQQTKRRKVVMKIKGFQVCCPAGCNASVVGLSSLSEESWQGTAGILQLCNTARHNVVIIYVPIYHAFY